MALLPLRVPLELLLLKPRLWLSRLLEAMSLRLRLFPAPVVATNRATVQLPTTRREQDRGTDRLFGVRPECG